MPETAADPAPLQAPAPAPPRRSTDARLVVRHVALWQCRECLRDFAVVERFLTHDCQPVPPGQEPPKRPRLIDLFRRRERDWAEAVEAMDRKIEVESSDGNEHVVFYRVPAGPWHRLLGMARGAGKPRALGDDRPQGTHS